MGNCPLLFKKDFSIAKNSPRGGLNIQRREFSVKAICAKDLGFV
jgi:hypothetical protein